MRPGWENELCLTLGATLNGPGVSEDDVKAAVATVAPALEIIEQRPPVGKGSGFLSGADNGQQRSFIVDAETAYDASIHDLGKASVGVYVDDEFEEKAYGIEVMESSPLSSIVWLTEGLARFGHELTAGSVVMTGSFTKQYRFEGPVEVEARLEPFGTVTASFT